MPPTNVSISQLQIEHLYETLGIGTACPRLSWKIETATPNWRQVAYEIECFSAHGRPPSQTGRVASSQSILVEWPFAPLVSREQVSVRLRVWGTDGSESTWSAPVAIEAGLLSAADWSARFISPAWDEDTTKSNPAPYLRREFHLHSGIKSARLYITALGLYEAEINGQVVGDQVFSPGWTVYDQRLRYQTFDVTEILQQGRNALGAILGDGWFRGRLGFGGGRRNLYGKNLALLAQLEVTYTDGSTECIITDESWRAATGPILLDSLYDGETYDARLEKPGWSKPGFDEAGWSGVHFIEWNLSVLETPLGPPVRRIERVKPVSTHQSPSGKTLVDFGQNLVGWLSIKVSGPAGHTITLRHAEVLENDELGIRPLRFAEATDRYTLKGSGVETWEPRFTFHGFRYVEVSDWPGVFDLSALQAVVLHSDMQPTGWFVCSDPLLNQLHKNVVWGMRGNFLDVPTDCPQRDERLGWTGDLQVFTPTASYLYDVSGLLQSWLKDLAAEQRKSCGSVPHVIPNILGANAAGGAAWGDAATVVPLVLYQRFGDAQILADQFKSMCAWVDYIAAAATNGLWDKGFQFGDWLDPTAPPDKPGQARTDKAVVASAYYVHSADLVAEAAKILGDVEALQKYSNLAAAARAAFAREYITPAGRLMSDAETAYALALVFELLPTAAQREHAGKRLSDLVRDSGYHIRTGFVGTPIICDALCQTGHFLTAYRLLLQQENPSWLYPVTMGATTIWERWDSMLPDGSINPGEMTSFNHYALGAVADWMHRTLGGLSPLEPGYRRLQFAPRPGGGIIDATTRHITPYGMAESAWKIENGTFTLDVIVPANCSGLVTLPGSTSALEVGSGAWTWSVPYIDPDARGPFTVNDIVGDILVNPASRTAILQALERAEIPEYLRNMLFTERHLPLRQALSMFPDYEAALKLTSEALSGLGNDRTNC